MNVMKIGVVGLDTSHVIAFAKLLNDHDSPYHVEGGEITVAFPGGSADFELSSSRVEGYTKELNEQYGVQIVRSPQAVAEQVDAILLESVDGRIHLEQFKAKSDTWGWVRRLNGAGRKQKFYILVTARLTPFLPSGVITCWRTDCSKAWSL
jgi:hypothetical protein